MRTALTQQARMQLVAASVVFAIANVMHGADHVRRGLGKPLLGETPEILVGGLLISAGAGFTLWLATRDSKSAPLVAMLVGALSALAISASHLAPSWGIFSDSFFVARPDLLSWAAVLLEIAAALVTSGTGVFALLERRRGPMAGGQRSPTTG